MRFHKSVPCTSCLRYQVKSLVPNEVSRTKTISTFFGPGRARLVIVLVEDADVERQARQVELHLQVLVEEDHEDRHDYKNYRDDTRNDTENQFKSSWRILVKSSAISVQFVLASTPIATSQIPGRTWEILGSNQPSVILWMLEGDAKSGDIITYFGKISLVLAMTVSDRFWANPSQ